MKHTAIALLMATFSFSAFAAAPDHSDLHKIGSISVTGATLTDMEAAMNKKAKEQGATSYKITSAHMGNRTWGTADLYQ